MLQLNPTPGNEVNPQLPAILDRNNLAQAPNFLRLLAQSPTVNRAYSAVEDEMANGKITAREREQIALAVAEINDSKYCLVAHTFAGRAAGISDDDIRLARKAAASDPKAGAMLRFTQAVLLQRGQLADEQFNAMRNAGFSELEVIEIIALIALNIFTNYLTLVFNTEVDIPLLFPEMEHAANLREHISHQCRFERP
jgi:uncharacterized peroxidase-related enzyme